MGIFWFRKHIYDSLREKYKNSWIVDIIRPAHSNLMSELLDDQSMEAEKVEDILLSFVGSSDERESEHLLARLIEDYAQPIVTRIVNHKTRSAWHGSSFGESPAESEDLRAEVMLQLVQRLQNFRTDYTERPISDFGAYVATTTYNACDRYISRKYPQRRRLKNGLRYLLTHRAGLALWPTKDEKWVGGFSKWRVDGEASGTSERVVSSADRIQQLRVDPRAFARGSKTHSEWHDSRHGYDLLHAIFAWTNAPVELDLLTTIVSDWWNVTDESVEIDAGRAADASDQSAGLQIADNRAAVSIETERRFQLQRIWDEIRELPPRQRAALLLNLRDEGGRGIVDLWIIVGLATPEAMAEVLSMTTEEFAEVWKELPLDDNRIAQQLGLTRQQVINLRKSARERLARRVKAF